MNYSRMFLNSKWDVHEIHELSTWSSEHNIHEIVVVHEQPGTIKLSSWASQTKFVLMLMNVHELFMKKFIHFQV